jgi:SSS family solute:Na+ symporter
MSKNASQKKLVAVGRISTLVFVIIGGVIAYFLQKFPTGIFTYIQEFQGFISPGVLAAFLFGFVVKRAPGRAGVAALVVNVIVYGLLLIFYSGYGVFNDWGITMGKIAFLNRMAISFVFILVVMTILTLDKPLPEPKVMPTREGYDMKATGSVLWLGVAVIIITLLLYWKFW